MMCCNRGPRGKLKIQTGAQPWAEFQARRGTSASQTNLELAEPIQNPCSLKSKASPGGPPPAQMYVWNFNLPEGCSSTLPLLWLDRHRMAGTLIYILDPDQYLVVIINRCLLTISFSVLYICCDSGPTYCYSCVAHNFYLKYIIFFFCHGLDFI